MSRWPIGVILLLGLAACSTPSPSVTPDVDQNQSPSGAVLAVIGTPFLVAFKSVLCAGTLAVAAPVSGIAGLNPDEDKRRQEMDYLAYGVRHNCGPPYVVRP